MTALAADVLNIKPVMHFSTGTLDTYQKCRGMKKARKVMIDAMKHELETNFREEYEAGNVYLMAASSSTDEVTAEWMAQIKESFPGIEIVDIRYSYDDEWVASKIVEEFLELYPELTGIYITGHGVKGVCQTLQKLGKDKTMHVIANDFLEENLKWLKEGTINFLIGQDAAVQGHSPVIILFQLLFDSKAPEKEYQYTDIVIRTKYNMG